MKSWARGAYNRTVTGANPGNRSPHYIFYGKIPQNSPTPFPRPGYCKYKRTTNKMEPKARECFYLGSARNHQRVRKSLFVHTGKVIVARNVVWYYVRSERFPTRHISSPRWTSVSTIGGRRGYDYYIPGEVTKITPCGDRTT